MVRDPYAVLGIQKGATQDEIKRAYRKKAKECHPDMHPDDPNATQKMNEVNEAYDMLMHPEKYRAQQNPFQGQSSSSQGNAWNGNPFYTYDYQGTGWSPFGDFFGFGGSPFYTSNPVQSDPSDPQPMRAAVSAIQGRRYQEALRILTEMPEHARNARWHYLMAHVHEGNRNTASARIEIQRAVDMDPNNLVYRQMLQNYTASADQYSSRSHGADRHVIDTRTVLGSLCLAQILCRFGCCFC